MHCGHDVLNKLFTLRVCLQLRNVRHFSQSMNIFDRNAKRLQKEIAFKNSDRHVYEYLKQEIAYRVADRVYDIKRLNIY